MSLFSAIHDFLSLPAATAANEAATDANDAPAVIIEPALTEDDTQPTPTWIPVVTPLSAYPLHDLGQFLGARVQYMHFDTDERFIGRVLEVSQSQVYIQPDTVSGMSLLPKWKFPAAITGYVHFEATHQVLSDTRLAQV